MTMAIVFESMLIAPAKRGPLFAEVIDIAFQLIYRMLRGR
jgi:hypothetical protein